MDSDILGILGFVLIFVALDLAALRFGHDSRSMTRELPLPGDAAMRIPPGTGRRLRVLLTLDMINSHARSSPPAPLCVPALIARAQRARKPFRPYAAGDVYAYPRFDMAAVGK